MTRRLRRFGPGLLVIALAAGSSLAAAQTADWLSTDPPRPPQGLAPVIWPQDNLYSRDKAELGWLLYFDKRLSVDNTVACASCHDPGKGFTDQAPVATGIRGLKGGRSAPTVINRAYSVEQFWDGRAPTLEEQAKGPISNPIEMGESHENVVRKLMAVPGYRERFRKVFGTDRITIDHVARAIATFERCVLSGNSPYDRYKAGDRSALTPSQVRGMNVFFNKAACDSCHFGVNFTDGQFTNVGIGVDAEKPDLGRHEVSKREEDKHAFKTPTLREIEHTGPYMHDGRFKTLEEVVAHYNKGERKSPTIDQRIKPLNLSEEDQKDLVAFLRALSGEGWQQIKPPARLPE